VKPKSRWPSPRSDGFRSGLEKRISDDLKARGIDPQYEAKRIAYIQPEERRTYRPDFILPNGILIEAKGRFTSADRKKHLHFRDSNPRLDVRFIFSNSNTKLRKGSPTSYADWCEKYGFKYADKLVPQEWLEEPPKEGL